MNLLFASPHRLRQLQAAKEYKPDAILLDIGFPGMDGYEVCRAFRKDEIFLSSPKLVGVKTGAKRLRPQQALIIISSNRKVR